MADIISNKSKLNTDEVAQDKPITEALHTKIGADINYLIDVTDDHETRLASAEVVIVSHEARLDQADVDFGALASQVFDHDNRITVLEGQASGFVGITQLYSNTFEYTLGGTTTQVFGDQSTEWNRCHIIKLANGNYGVGQINYQANIQSFTISPVFLDTGYQVAANRWATVRFDHITLSPLKMHFLVEVWEYS